MVGTVGWYGRKLTFWQEPGGPGSVTAELHSSTNTEASPVPFQVNDLIRLVPEIKSTGVAKNASARFRATFLRHQHCPGLRIGQPGDQNWRHVLRLMASCKWAR